ncbi:Trihelix transcription factor A [Sesamum alatum]|uniref:Trihelix transcription factor A n=1 Tax=Sesamum alatum TaxID=300844 RepID=A0AAE1XMG3_9LAMI|nr:Trihelix transcription factor A [Sesamum alatum]
MAPGQNRTHENAESATDVVGGPQPVTDERNKTPRHPRWTQQETMVLIEGKKIVEERGRMGRRSTVFGSDQLEPKWDAVSSYCRRHGVSRGPVQCRKRWSNLLSDFKKIKAWEVQVGNEDESFWMMRSDLRRERRLPGFFDCDVYDVLDGKGSAKAAYQLALVTRSVDENTGDGIDVEVEEDDEMVEDEEAGDGLFSEFEQVDQEEIGKSPQNEKVQKDGQTDSIPFPVPISEMKYQPFHQADPNQGKKRQEGPHFRRASEFQEGLKRRRQSSNDQYNVDVEDLLIKAIERNTNLLHAQVEEQKLNCQLEREQQKEQHDSIIASLSKITDALEKIANKL